MTCIQLFVYGGSSSVGQYAIQLAKLSGYKVVTTASKRNHQLVESLGADLAFDVSNPLPISRFALG
jgi:NADPH:quinone reductase-like Zn-dependent oxidoreductase